MKQSNYCLKQLTNLVVYFSYKGLLTKNEKKGKVDLYTQWRFFEPDKLFQVIN